uniref:Uncharacterized protein n=1 Tax=Strombidium inclinatum TaxID=197538 RepID=A0A7S3IWF3_9SPIT|mmetsp:Transcript_5846/g.9386  ORF Transcript_5846/g.9386 Transcript_5846/m.9386 type:complete len:100 (+) Transcript_5846:3167-3466(+)
MALAISCLLAMFCVCGCLICCSYCQMEQQYDQLEMTVRDNAREAGLPDDYDFNEDNVYMQELRREEELKYGVVQRAENEEESLATKRRGAVEEEETGHI